MNEICSKFNAIPWHDSKLLTFELVRCNDGEKQDLYIKLQLRVDSKNNRLDAKTLILEDCHIVMMNLDLKGKYICSDDISSATCSEGSPLKDKLMREFTSDEANIIKDCFHFRITCIPPGGEIDVLAKNFELKGS